jgi:uncharacterized membrane protein
MHRTARRTYFALAPAATITIGLAVALLAIVWWRYTIFRDDVDLGIFTQVIGSVGHGFSTTAEGGASHLLVHWSPIIVLAWPMLKIFGPIGLQYTQALLVASTLIPIYALARARAGNLRAIVLTAVAALYPTLWGNAVGDFHEMGFVPLLSATFVYALDQRKWMLCSLAVLALLCTKEDQFVILAWNGLTIAVTNASNRVPRNVGLFIALAAAITALFYFGVVRPHIGPGIPYLTSRFYSWDATSAAIVAAPGTFLSSRVAYVAIVLAPLLFLPCISRYGLFLIPGILEITASHMPVTLMPGAHYSALLTGYALAAFVDGFDRLRKWSVPACAVAIGVAAAVAISIQIFASPMEYWYYLYRPPDAHDVLLERTLRSIPGDGNVGAEDEIFAHLGLDPNASVGFHEQEWFVYDDTHFSTKWHDVDRPAVRKMVKDGTYRVISSDDGIVVLRKLH